jgi:general secretion pathway protein G
MKSGRKWGDSGAGATPGNSACLPGGFERGAAARPTRREAGLTLIELIVAFTIMLVLTTMSVPLVRAQLRRNRERELRAALVEMRKAIDKFKDAADKNQIAPTALTPESMGYPQKLEDLVNGVKGVGASADVKVKFLRRIPKDPMTNSFDWGKRSMQDDPKTTGWGGQNVFDVFTKSGEVGLDGIPYSEW